MTVDRAFMLLNLAIVLVSVTAHEVASGTFLYLTLTASVCAAAWYLYVTKSMFRIGSRAATLMAGSITSTKTSAI